jgi:hypothetical protein
LKREGKWRVLVSSAAPVPSELVTYFVTNLGELLESTIAAAISTALPVRLHKIGQPGPAGAMPFIKLVTSRGQ